MVLLIACANLANLMLARAASRDREMAVRQAVGASRGRLVRQLLTESLLLSAVGGALALVVAQWLSAAVLGFFPADSSAALPNLAFHSSARVIGACATISLATCLLFGLAPAVRATRPSAVAALRIRAETGGGERRWTSRALVVCEVSLCVFLLIGAGLFVRSLRNLLTVDAGFAAKQVVVADVEFPREYEQATRTQLLEELSQRAAMLPDVRVAGYSQIGQMSGFGIEYPVHVRAQSPLQGQAPSAFEQRVSPGFLAAMGTSLLSGRDFDARDGEGSPPVAIVNESFVRQFLSTGQPLGQRFGTDGPESSGNIEIVGVVVDSKWIDLRETRRPMYYRPFRQRPIAGATLVVRTTGRLEPVIGAISGIVHATDRRVALRNAAAFTDIVNRTLAIDRMVALASAVFGLLALLIVCAGLFGVLAYGVARRTREIGVRMALGATPSALQWMVLRESLLMLAAGLPIGVVAALVGTRFVASMLFGLTSADPATIAGASALLTVVSLAAAYVPARRATRVDPLTALRAE
jgi:predicted permease